MAGRKVAELADAHVEVHQLREALSHAERERLRERTLTVEMTEEVLRQGDELHR